VVEARQRLLDARNTYVNNLVAYEILRVQLQRDLGVLQLDEQGMWRT
jgi:outer membrane protein TolC